MMKRITTPKLLGLLAGSLLLFVALFSVLSTVFDQKPPPGGPLLWILLVILLLLIALASIAILAWRLMKRLGVQKSILICGTLAFVLCGLFPPWLGTSIKGHAFSSEYGFIFSPPAGHNTKLDFSRLAVEWICIGAITGAMWIIFAPRKPAKELDSKS